MSKQIRPDTESHLRISINTAMTTINQKLIFYFGFPPKVRPHTVMGEVRLGQVRLGCHYNLYPPVCSRVRRYYLHLSCVC